MKTSPKTQAISRRPSEAEFVKDLSIFFLAKGYRVDAEVSNMGQSADLVAQRGRWITCIEAKLSDWKRAVQQCRAHECVADFVCVALDRKNVPLALVEIAKSQGYGIIHRNSESENSFNWAVRPRRNTKTWQPQRQRLINTLRWQRNEY